MKIMSFIAAAGLATAIAGFVYGVVAVGVPTQDATPAQATAERRAMSLSGWAMAGGGAVTVVGLAGMAGMAMRRRPPFRGTHEV